MDKNELFAHRLAIGFGMLNEAHPDDAGTDDYEGPLVEPEDDDEPDDE